MAVGCVASRGRCGREAGRRALLVLATCCCLLLPTPTVGAPPYSVRLNLADDFLAKGWTARYYQPYSHATQLSDIVMPYHASSSYCMLMGAKTSASSSTLVLAAIVDAASFDDPTSLNSPRYTRGVYWHMTDTKSCGFAADSALSQSSADTATSNAAYRLSWHLGQSPGGYRAGGALNLNDNNVWYKVVYFISTHCDSLNDDYSINLPGPSLGVQLNMPDTLAAAGWTKIYDQPYSHGTQPSDMPASSSLCVFVGAKTSSSASTFALGAFTSASSLVTSTATNQPHESRGVWWYATSSKSIGFSADYTISQGSADTGTTLPERRLSWHYGGGGGWRAGTSTNLNSDSTWRKLVYQAPFTCADISDDLTMDLPGTTEFPDCSNGLAGPRCSCSPSGSAASTQLDMSITWEAGNTRFKIQLTYPHTTNRHVQAVAIGPARCKVLQSSDFSCSATSSCPCTAYVSWSSFVDACYAGQGLGPGDREFIVPLFVQWRQWATGEPHATFQREQFVRVA